MGVGHLAIGEGIGDTKVFNPNPAIQMYGQMLAQRKVKQDADNKYLGDILAKGYDSSTLRNDADRASYLKQYGDIKQSAINIADEKDPVKKALGLAQVRQQLGDLGTYAENSKKQGLQEHAWAQSYMTNPTNWDDKALEAYRTSKESELNTPETIKDFTTLQRRIDPQKMDKVYDYLKKSTTDAAKWNDGIQTPGEMAGKNGSFVTQKRGISMDGDNGALEAALHMASAYPEFGKYLQGRYPSIQGQDASATLGMQMKQYMHDRGDKDGFFEETKPVFKEAYKPEKPDMSLANHIAIKNWDRAHGFGDVVGAQVPKDQTIFYKDGKASVNTKGYVGVNSAPINMVGQQSYNLSTGEKDTEVLPSGDYQLVGITNTPFITGNYTSGKTPLKGTIAQPSFVEKHPKDIQYRPTLHVQTKDADGNIEDKLVPADRIPKNLPKATLEALRSFKPYSAATSVKPTDTKTLITVQLPNGTTGQIPKEKYNDFIKKYPTAKTLQ